ncbi:hypothetical protein [Entomomonas asaccharolytica]|uniref:Uncharacterized protein n=1 Tax=Entomomonas asaccharolytica TaxID=2785331 RepID=A0A974RY93_9GAMM|nr:hypothetical protein [Entomomonas asaccharolytica]QQP86962.1 hypothetical protein JHT90_06870 [Entomomonas asaccharolytica]
MKAKDKTVPFINETSCDEEVYKKGSVFEILDIPKEKANEYCRELNLSDDSYKYDWHYFGGRVVVKRLEREFLRKEEELNRLIEVQVEANGSYITVFDGRFSHNEIFNLNAIFKDITLKIIRDMYFKNGNGCYRFKFLSPYIGFVDIPDHTHFELIDFKPLD